MQVLDDLTTRGWPLAIPPTSAWRGCFKCLAYLAGISLIKVIADAALLSTSLISLI